MNPDFDLFQLPVVMPSIASGEAMISYALSEREPGSDAVAMKTRARHFTSDAGEPVAITTHVHLLSEQITAGLDAGWALAEMHEGVVDEAWLAVKPKWRRYRATRSPPHWSGASQGRLSRSSSGRVGGRRGYGRRWCGRRR